MQDPIEAMKTALRVLTALTERSKPDERDLQAMRECEPDLADLPPDELACEVIQHALRQRANMRAAK